MGANGWYCLCLEVSVSIRQTKEARKAGAGFSFKLLKFQKGLYSNWWVSSLVEKGHASLSKGLNLTSLTSLAGLFFEDTSLSLNFGSGCNKGAKAAFLAAEALEILTSLFRRERGALDKVKFNISRCQPRN